MIRLQELELVFGQTHNGQQTTDGWTDRRDVGNSILDLPLKKLPFLFLYVRKKPRLIFSILFIFFCFGSLMFATYILLLIEVRKISWNQRLWELERFLEIVNPSLYLLISS